MIVRIAAGLAFNSAPEHRWRRVAVPVAAAIFVLSVLSASGVLLMLQRETGRAEQRTALLSTEPSPTDLLMMYGDDWWGGQQFTVVWIDPAGDAGPVLPPGVSRLPEPGQAVVSPALARLAAENSILAKRYEGHLVIGPEGVRSGDELFAYVRVPEGRSLAGEEVTRASRFGQPKPGQGQYVTLDFTYLPVQPIVAGVVGFLVVPGSIVLIVGVAAASNVRDRRFQVLQWVGTRGRTLAALAVIETLILAAPGLVAATVLLGLIAPRLESVPLVSHEVTRGDLGLPWWVLLAGLAAGVVATALASVAVMGARRLENTGPRPSNGRAVVTPLSAAPLVLALLALSLGWIVQGGVGANLKLAGIVCAVVGAPLVLPGMLRATGVGLGRLGSVPTLIAGRGLEWDPVRTSRPFLGLAALIVIALAGSGIIALVNHTESPSVPAGEARTVTVDWLDPQRGDVERLANNLGSGLVLPKREGGIHGHGGHGHGNTVAIGGTCPQLADYFPDAAACAPGAPLRLPEDVEQRLVQVAALGPPNTEVQLVPRDEIGDTGTAVVLDDSPLAPLEERVRSAAMQTLPVPYVTSPLGVAESQSELVPWLIGGILFSVIALAAGCFISLVDRLLGTRKHRRHLLDLGVSPQRLTVLEVWLFAVPYGAVTVLSFCVGLVLCVLTVSPAVPLPWRGIALTLALTVVAGLIGAIGMTFFGARNARENPE